MDIDRSIDALWGSIQSGSHDPESLHGKLSIEDAYQVQLGILAKYEDAGDVLVGWKVGLTAPAIQQQLGFHEPVFGFLLGSGHRQSSATFDFTSLIRPGFENELCLTIDQTLTGPGVTLSQAREAIATVAPAIEIIEKRVPIPAEMALALADNGQQKAFVTGKAMPLGDLDLGNTMVEVIVNGLPQERAKGIEVQGTPIASVQWLANKLSQFGRKLEAGSVVMSGSFTKQYDINRGDLIEANFDPIGVVIAKF